VRVALAVHQVRATGGQDRYVLELARHLAGTCEVHIIAARVEGPLPAAVRVHRLAVPRRPLLLAAPLFRRAAARAVAPLGCDVVHGIGGALPGASVITAPFCHAAWLAQGGPRSAYQRLVSLQAVRDERRAYHHPRLAAVIAVSARTAAELERHYGPLAAPLTVIPNGVDLETFTLRSGGAREAGRRRRILFVGAYGRKGLETAIAALAAMRCDAELVAVGDGDRAAFRRQAARAGVGDRVRLEPPRGGIAAVMADADLFLFPTRYEPFGMVIAEAMACGVPVVTSAAAGAAELIQEGVSGRVIADPRDAPAFAAAADSVLADETGRMAMGRAARQAVGELGWDRIAARTLEVYRRVAGEGTP
jgi:glycosyltransferase involved in cell wall biosynthesis